MFGVVDEDNEERVCTAVVPATANTVTAREVRRWVREHHGATSVPERVLLLDALPTTGSQKPDRVALRRMATKNVSE